MGCLQLEGFDAELETLQTGGGKKRGKPPPRLTHMEESISRHKAHVVRLEAIMRLLDNGTPFSAPVPPALECKALPALTVPDLSPWDNTITRSNMTRDRWSACWALAGCLRPPSRSVVSLFIGLLW